MQRTRVCYRQKHTAHVSCLRLVAARTKILMGGKLAVVRILTEPESSVTSGLFMGGGTYGADHRSTRAKARKSPQLRSELAALARQGGRGGDWVQSTAIHYLFLLSVITLDTRPPSSQYVNQCVARHNAATQMAPRASWWKERACCRSRWSRRRHQLLPRSERKGTYSRACARKDNYCGQRSSSVTPLSTSSVHRGSRDPPPTAKQ